MATFADTLKALLAERGMSQAELARRVGVTAQAVSGWVAGGVTPTHENIVRIEEEAGAEKGSLLSAAGYSAVKAGGPTVESLLRSDNGISAEDKRVFLHLLKLARERYAAQAS